MAAEVNVPAGAAPVLLATKLNGPVRRGVLHRERLLAALRAAADHQLTVLDAPAGWGKTSLLADWHASVTAEPQIAWLALDPEDNDPTLFWAYVIAALRAARPGFGRYAEAALGARSTLVAAVLPSLVNELSAVAEHVILVLDDYHAITNPEVHGSIAFLLDHQPRQLHLVLATRSDPPLPLARLRAAGELREIRARDLGFTQAEAALLLNDELRLQLSDRDVARLSRRTEGWPAGLYLAALSMTERTDRAAFVEAFTGTDRFILDYLTGEVLAGLPAELSEFMLRTSILDRLTGELCDAVTARTDSAKLLDTIGRNNLFLVPLDSDRSSYRYHHLFGELLRHELRMDLPGEVVELHLRAAAYFRARGAVPEAVEHAVAAGDLAEAGELVAMHWNGYFNAGQLTTVEAWLDRLPSELVMADVQLCLARVWVLLDRGQLADADPWITAADAAVGRLGPGAVIAARDAAVVRAVHRFKIGDVAASQVAARRVLELNQGEVCFAATVAQSVLGLTLFWQGESRVASRRLTEAARLCRQLDNQLGETYALGYLAAALLEQGELAEAERVARLALEQAADPGVGEHFVSALPNLALAVALSATGRVDAAAPAAVRAAELAERGAGRLEIAITLGTLAQVLLGLGRDSDAVGPLTEARRLARTCRDPGRLPEMLGRIGRAGVGTRSRRAEPDRAPAGQPGDVRLSERELDLLPLLAGTLSQREIGGVLHVSLNTVKTQCRLLYRKLGVTSRDEAVSRARDLQLL